MRARFLLMARMLLLLIREIHLRWEKRISVEMLSTFGWDKFAKHHMGLDTFGASAPAKDVIKKFDFTADRLVKMVEEIVK